MKDADFDIHPTPCIQLFSANFSSLRRQRRSTIASVEHKKKGEFVVAAFHIYLANNTKIYEGEMHNELFKKSELWPKTTHLNKELHVREGE